MFFFLKPEIDISSYPENKILQFLLFLLFPRAVIVWSEDPMDDEEFWNDNE